MRFDPEALSNKQAHLDRVLELPWIVDEVLRRNLRTSYEVAHLPRSWEPGGGSTLFRVDAGPEQMLLKIKHETVWVESALEGEPGFPRKPSLSNEVDFLTSLSGEWLPRVRFFDEEAGFQLLALEWLEPFETANERLDAAALLRAWQDLRAAARALFDQGVVHTDLHEHNLCFRGDRIVIVDFEEARRLAQSGPFEASLDACGETSLGNLGAYPESDHYEPRWTCLARLEQVFRDRVSERLPELLARCAYDRDCEFNRDPLQEPDPRVYQSVRVGDVEVAGQRPAEDRRLDWLRILLRGLARDLGPIHHLDVGANLGAFCIAASREACVDRSVGVEGAAPFVDAARALAFVEGSDAEFHVKVCGRDALAGEIGDANVVTLLSVHHHIESKDAFLADLARIGPEVLIAEMASQDRFYPERGSLAAEIDEIQRVLGLGHRETIATSGDYGRPLLVLSRAPLSRRLRTECRIRALDPAALPKRARARAGRVVRRVRRALQRDRTAHQPDLHEGLTRAVAWLRARQQPDGGLAVSDVDPTPYPEVTGYAIPTLHAWGQHELAQELARWLVTIQNDDGSWSAPGSTTPYTFDTGQILKGLLATDARADGFEESVRRGCDWLLTRIGPDGRVDTPDTRYWALPGGRRVPDSIHLYALEPLRIAADRFGVPSYRDGVARAVRHYSERPGLVDFDTLSHFHAYVVEAWVDLGEPELARRGLREIAWRQRQDGALPAYPDAHWVCTPAVAQYAVAWYALDDRAPADRALAYLRSIQRPSGGFRGSSGRRANYFPEAEITWAAKFFLDAAAWHIRRDFDHDVARFPDRIDPRDPRLAAVLRGMPDLDAPRILDAGCGKGRFARALAEQRPDARLVGVDLSDALLANAPDSLEKRRGSILDLPCADGEFDYAFGVEVLEHAVDPRAAVRELSRVVRPGGHVVIVDKDARRAGALETAAWEQWLDRSQVERWLGEACDSVSVEDIAGPDLPDGLFVAWRGRVRGDVTR
jgi:malonyl-CoA O-methyltransferase